MLAAAAAAEMPRIPAGLDAYLPVPGSNPLTSTKVELGKRLFFDKRLSADGTLSCASCHDPEYAFGDKNPLARGIRGQVGVRRTPRLINRGYGSSFFWDGRAATLEEQVVQPLGNRIEMGPSLSEAAARTGIAEATLRDALASYVRTILSGNSAFDRYMAGEAGALDMEQRQGLELFTGKAGCSGCHVGPNFTDERFHNTGAGTGADRGRAAVTGREQDRGAFKTPSLREAARTPPYMHDGSLATLEQVIDFYDKGGHANPHLDPEIRALHLSQPERAALASFLRALNGTVRDGL